MSTKPKKRIAPTLIDANANASAAVGNLHQKKNPLENAADLIAMRYGVSTEAPHIDDAVFKQNRDIGKKVVPLKEYFEQTAKDFVQKEAKQKEEAAQKKREYAKLTPCQRKMNTLQRNIDGYVKGCDLDFSNEAVIELLDKARIKAGKTSVKKSRKLRKLITPKKGGRTRQRKRKHH